MPRPYTGSRTDTWLIHVELDGVFLGPWDQISGGEITAEELKYRPGGQDWEISLGGRTTTGNVTVVRFWDEWWTGMYAWAMTRVGKGRGYIARYPMTADWERVGRGQAYQGTLTRLSPPDYDSMGSDVALCEMEFTCDRYWS
jgi:hypothetical protein